MARRSRYSDYREGVARCFQCNCGTAEVQTQFTRMRFFWRSPKIQCKTAGRGLLLGRQLSRCGRRINPPRQMLDRIRCDEGTTTAVISRNGPVFTKMREIRFAVPVDSVVTIGSDFTETWKPVHRAQSGLCQRS